MVPVILARWLHSHLPCIEDSENLHVLSKLPDQGSGNFTSKLLLAMQCKMNDLKCHLEWHDYLWTLPKNDCPFTERMNMWGGVFGVVYYQINQGNVHSSHSLLISYTFCYFFYIITSFWIFIFPILITFLITFCRYVLSQQTLRRHLSY